MLFSTLKFEKGKDSKVGDIPLFTKVAKKKKKPTKYWIP